MQNSVVRVGEKDFFHQFINEAQLESNVKQVLLEAEINKVKVNRRKKEWQIYLKCKDFIPMHQFKALAVALKKRIQGLHNLILIPCFPKNLLDDKSIVEDYWPFIIEMMQYNMPAAGHWLLKAPIETNEDALTIKLPNLVLVEYFQKKKYPEKISQLLSYMLDRPTEVDLLVEESPHSASEFKDWEREEINKKIIIPPSNMEKSNKSDNKSEVPTHSNENRVLMGKPISTQPIPIENIVEEEKSVVVKGRLFDLEIKELRSGRTLVTFNLTDNTNTITVKFFENEKNKGVSEQLKENQWLLVRGSVQEDRYSQELTIMAFDIALTEVEERQDLSPEKRIELHLHTKMSALDGLTDINAVVKRAAQWGHPALAITDHGVVQAFPEAYEAGKKYNVKIIYGMEGYLIDRLENPTGKERRYHIILLAKNQKGLENLYRLITLSHLKYFHRRPRIPRQELERYREGLILGSACEAGELIQAILKKSPEEELERIASFYDYLEVQPLSNNEFMVNKGMVDWEGLKEINRTIVKLGEKLGKPVVATGDVHFLDPEDAIFRRILMCGQGFEDQSQPPLYFKTTEEMLAEFEYLGSEKAYELVIKNPKLIADSVEDVKPFPDELYPPEIPGAEEQIINMSHLKAKEIYGEDLPQVVRERLEKELNSIISNGFAVLYFIAHKLVKKSNEDGYLVGSRGSVGSSFVATLTGITEVNPLPPHYVCPQCKHSEFILDGSYNCGVDMPDKYCPQCGTLYRKDGHDIPFETFLGFKGDKIPDIDLNFSGEYQPRAHKYTESLFGKEHVFRAGTIATIAEKTAFGFVKNYFQERGQNPRNAEIARLVKGCTGVKRTTGQHPGGLMVVPKSLDIHKFTPLQRPADDINSEVITTHFDYHSISDRLVKLDILGHDDPTVIKMLEDLTGVDAKTIPLDEPKTMSIFSSVEALNVKPEDIGSEVGTFGIPEFGTRFVRQMLEETRPKTFSELVRISGFSHGTDVWLNNAQDLIKNGIAKLSEAISTRDDIMLYLIYKGMEPSIAFKIMEDVRKGKGVKPEYEQAMKECNVPDWYIESCKKIKYMFPKAHAVAYVTMAFRIAYYKVYHPLAFYASFFTVKADEFDASLMIQGLSTVKQTIQEIENKGNEATAKEKNLMTILEVVLEMYQRGIRMRRVNLWESDATKFKIVDGELLPPFVALQGLGTTAAMNIVSARQERKFTSIEDLRVRARLSKTVIEIMREHGCLDGLTETDQLSFFDANLNRTLEAM